jgi:hypothetical protein
MAIGNLGTAVLLAGLLILLVLGLYSTGGQG